MKNRMYLVVIMVMTICAASFAQSKETNINSITISGRCVSVIHAGTDYAFYKVVVSKSFQAIVRLDIPVDFSRIDLPDPLSLLVSGYVVRGIVNGRYRLIIIAQSYKWFNVKKGNLVEY